MDCYGIKKFGQKSGRYVPKRDVENIIMCNTVEIKVWVIAAFIGVGRSWQGELGSL